MSLECLPVEIGLITSAKGEDVCRSLIVCLLTAPTKKKNNSVQTSEIQTRQNALKSLISRRMLFAPIYKNAVF